MDTVASVTNDKIIPLKKSIEALKNENIRISYN